MNRGDRIVGFLAKVLILLALALPLWWIALLIGALVYPIIARISTNPETTALLALVIGLTPAGYVVAWLFGASNDDRREGAE